MIRAGSGRIRRRPGPRNLDTHYQKKKLPSMTAKKLIAVIILLSGLSILACGAVGILIYNFLAPTQVISSPVTTSEVIETTPATPQIGAESARATPVSQQPAAGICASAEGDYVLLEISGDMPSPRCVIAHLDQRLRIINRTDMNLSASLAGKQFDLQPGEEGTIDVELGSFLLPGVHEISTSAYAAPSLWLQGD